MRSRVRRGKRGDRTHWYIDWSPDLKGSDRFLWGVMGQSFDSEQDADVKPTKRPSTAGIAESLIDRDDGECFFCGEHTSEHEASVEHLIPLSAGGPHHSANMVLAHTQCNELAGSKTVVEKVQLRDRLRRRGRPTAGGTSDGR